MSTTGVDVKKNVTVPITSDKGLCGGINTTITKYTRATDAMLSGSSSMHIRIRIALCWIRSQRCSPDGEGKEHHIFIVGDKGRSQLSRVMPKKISFTVADTAKGRITYALVRIRLDCASKALDHHAPPGCQRG